jgi:hypothetical protein
MSTDLLTQLAEYGRHHRETQEPVQAREVAHRGLRPVSRPRPNFALRRAGAALIAAALVTALIAVPALLRGPEAEGPAESVASTAPPESPSSVTRTTLGFEGGPDGYTMVHTLADGSLVALSQMNVWRSVDGGATWEEWYARDHEIDLLAVAPDGAIVTVRNPNETAEALGPGSVVNGTPEIHRYDPSTEVWTVLPLPRPDLPEPDLAPQAEDIDQCGLFGLQSWVDGSSIAVGEQIVILGDHRVVGDGICDEDFQFLWASANGLDWSLIPEIPIDGYLTGLLPNADQYVGYGSSTPSYQGPGTPQPQIWVSTDLDSWVEWSLDLSTLPQGAIVHYWPEVAESSDGRSLTFPVERYRPGLDSSITDIDALRQWRIDAGLPASPTDEMSLAESLEFDGIDFPLDDEELRLLSGFYDVREPIGTLTLTSVDGTDWEANYNPG